MWIRLNTHVVGDNHVKGSEFKIRLKVASKRIAEHTVDIPRNLFVKDKDTKIQVLARWPVEALSLEKDNNLTIEFASPRDGEFSVVGYGLSHLEFREEPKLPSPHESLFTITTDKDRPVKAAMPAGKANKVKAPKVKAQPNIPGAPEVSREAKASGKLKLAKDLLKKGKDELARKRLAEIVRDFGGTEAATEAMELLKDE